MDLRSRFGFHCVPFTRELENDHLLKLSFLEEALVGIRDSVERRMSAALISPAGSGKTALGRRLVADLPEARYATTYIKVTSLSKRDMCREIARLWRRYRGHVRRARRQAPSPFREHLRVRGPALRAHLG